MVECNFDGGDCCGPNVNTVYCTQCQCLTGDDGLKKLAEIIDYKKWHAKLEIYEAWSTLFETN